MQLFLDADLTGKLSWSTELREWDFYIIDNQKPTKDYLFYKQLVNRGTLQRHFALVFSTKTAHY